MTARFRMILVYAFLLLAMVAGVVSCDYVGMIEDRLPTEIEEPIYSEWVADGVTLSGAHGVLTEVPVTKELYLRYQHGAVKGEMAGSLRLVEYTETMPDELPFDNYAGARFIFDTGDPSLVRVELPELDMTRHHFLTLLYKSGKKNYFAHIAIVPTIGVPNANKKHLTAVISDIHMNDARALAYGYSWFKSNKHHLIEYVDYLIAHSDEYRELVLLGDVFDEYVTPVPFPTFATITNQPLSESEYIRSIAQANQDLIDKFVALQNAGVELVYVPGNHDMGATEADIRYIFGENVRIISDKQGLGTYQPNYAPQVLMEHSHRYDVMCAPDPLSNIGIDSVNPNNAFLPAGYFTTRIGATSTFFGLRKTDLSNFNLTLTDLKQTKKGGTDEGNYSILKAVWNVVAIAKPVENLEETPIPTGLNGLVSDYTLSDYSLIGSKRPAPILYTTMYKQTEWEQRLTFNGAPADFPFVLGAVFCEVPDVYNLVALWLHNKDEQRRIIILGHTHQPELSIQRASGKQHGFIYANTGSWVDEEASSYYVRTYVEIDDIVFGYKRVTLQQWNTNNIVSWTPALWLKE